MNNYQLEEIVKTLLPHFRKMVKGKYAIALGGSHAKGYADSYSDIDFYVYTEDVIEFSDRKKIIENIANKDQDVYIEESIDKNIWGASTDFYYQSTKIESTFKSLIRVSNNIQNCLAGKIEIEHTVWTLYGYYNYICLAEVNFIRAIEDPYQIISDWKEQIKTYPKELKKAIINEFWWKANFWLDNFHYKTAIKRCDFVYTSGIIQHTVHSFVQVLFALNESYFNGDKKIEEQLQKLRNCPRLFTENIEYLLSVYRDEEMLNNQRSILLEIASSIKEMMIELLQF